MNLNIETSKVYFIFFLLSDRQTVPDGACALVLFLANLDLKIGKIQKRSINNLTTSTMLKPACVTHSDTIGLTPPGAFQVRFRSSWNILLRRYHFLIWMLPQEEAAHTVGLAGEIVCREGHWGTERVWGGICSCLNWKQKSKLFYKNPRLYLQYLRYF